MLQAQTYNAAVFCWPGALRPNRDKTEEEEDGEEEELNCCSLFVSTKQVTFNFQRTLHGSVGPPFYFFFDTGVSWRPWKSTNAGMSTTLKQ